MHKIEPVTEAYCPATHAEQETAPAGAYWPEAHEVHVRTPAVPAAHTTPCEQALAPAAEYVFAAHVTQALAPATENEPPGQLVHTVPPTVAVNNPAAQLAHAAEPAVGWTVPARQKPQEKAPTEE